MVQKRDNPRQQVQRQMEEIEQAKDNVEKKQNSKI